MNWKRSRRKQSSLSGGTVSELALLISITYACLICESVYLNVTCLTHQSRPKQIMNAVFFSGLIGVHCTMASTVAWRDGRKRQRIGRKDCALLVTNTSGSR
jgi:hypothetical protein